MKSMTKSNVMTTISMLAAVSLMAACGSKKAVPADPKKPEVAPTVNKVEPAKMIPGNFTVIEVTCSKEPQVSDEGKKMIGAVLELREDNHYTLTTKVPESSPTIGTFEQEEKKIAFKKTVPSKGEEVATETITEFEYAFAGDDLSFKIQDEKYCPKDETAELKFKRTSAIKPEEAKSTTTPVDGTKPQVEEKTATN